MSAPLLRQPDGDSTASLALKRLYEHSGRAIVMPWYFISIFSRVYLITFSLNQRINQATTKVQHETFKRAVRSVPGSGEVWARYIRYLERGQDTEDTESVAGKWWEPMCLIAH